MKRLIIAILLITSACASDENPTSGSDTVQAQIDEDSNAYIIIDGVNSPFQTETCEFNSPNGDRAEATGVIEFENQPTLVTIGNYTVNLAVGLTEKVADESFQESINRGLVQQWGYYSDNSHIDEINMTASGKIELVKEVSLDGTTGEKRTGSFFVDCSKA